MTIKQIIINYSKKLKSSSPILDIELLLTKTLNKSKEHLFTYPKKKLTQNQLARFKQLYNRRSKGEPIAYILGNQEFFNLKFKVNKNVLIPRPESEILVEEVIKFTKNKKLTIADIGVGSGAIIIALAKNLKGQFYGSDISSKAITVAQKNAKANKVKIKFLKGNLLDSIKNNKIDIITANLPYLDKNEKNLLPHRDTRGLKFEPKIALNGGDDGLKYYRDFFGQIKKYNLKPRAIFLEIGHTQASQIKKLAKQVLPQYKFKVKKDLCGFDRIVIISK
jgi:release factor glutamine methyltransferase